MAGSATGHPDLEVQHEVLFGLLKRAARDEVLKAAVVDDSDVPLAIERVLDARGLGEVRSALFAEGKARAAPEGSSVAGSHPRTLYGPPLPPVARRPDQLDLVLRLQAGWAEHIFARLCHISQALGQPYERPLAPGAGGAGGAGADESRAAPVPAAAPALAQGEALHPYDPSELLERICALRHPNASSAYTGVKGAGLLVLELSAPSVAELQAAMPELSNLKERHIGADDELHAWFADEHQRVGERLVAAGDVPELRRYARTGVPTNLRPKVWAALLGVGVTARDAACEAMQYDRLVADISTVALLTDDSVRADVRLALDDEAFFVFAETLEEVLLCLVRDPWISQRAHFSSGAALRGDTTTPYLKGRAPLFKPRVDLAAEGSAFFPPSGLVPFRGLASFACPVCYVCGEPREVYLLTRALWARHWCGLHALSAVRGGLLKILKTFEMLLQEKEPFLVHHLTQLGAHPTELAFDWLVYAFVGFLEVEQVLLLWDRVLGFDSLDVLALAAAAVLAFKRDALLEAVTAEDVADFMQDGSSLKIVPLMQDFLARDGVG